MLHYPFNLPVLFPALDGLPLVILVLTLGNPQQNLSIAMLDVHLQRNQGNPLVLEGSGQAVNLLRVEKKLPVPQRILIEVGSVIVLADVKRLDIYF